MKIGPYEILGELGRGGMGVVHRARSPEGREVALKVLLRVDGEARARFERERRLLASLGEEKGFVPVLDAGEVPGGDVGALASTLYLAMPLLGGGTLRDRLGRGPQTIEATVELGRALGRALGEAHALGIVHRDLKPENVLFTAQGKPLVADLGLAKHFQGGPSAVSQGFSRSGELLGTVAYMAPEQVSDARTAGPPADVFALGAILYECLAGRPAFAGATALEVLTQVAGGTCTPLRSLRPDVPAALAAAVERALAPSLAVRFPDGSALARALAPGRAGRRSVARLGLGLVAVLAAGLALGLVSKRGTSGSGRVPAGTPRPGISGPGPSPAGTPVPGPSPSAPAPPGGASPVAVEASWRRLSARARVGAGDVPGAIADLTRAIELTPGSPVPRIERGAARERLGDGAGAAGDFSEAIRVGPEDVRAWLGRGGLRVRQGDAQGAFADMNEAVRVDPLCAGAWEGRGAARTELGQDELAIADCTEALRLDPSLASAWTNRATARLNRGEYAAAAADCTEAIRLEPERLQAWSVRGVARSYLEDHAGARADGEEAVRRGGETATVWSNRGLTRLMASDYAGAAADFTESLRIDPKLATAWSNRGAARARLGETAGAIADLERALELMPDDPLAPRIRQDLEGLRRGGRGP